mgnify:CR=1 FL=1
MIQVLVKVKYVGDAGTYGFKKGEYVNWEVYQLVVKDMKRQGLDIPVYENKIVKDV